MPKQLTNLILVLLLTFACWGFYVPDFFTTNALAQKLPQDTAALQLFQNAYNSRYTWDEQFPGYTADVEIKSATGNYIAQVQVNPDLTVKLTGLKDEKIQRVLSEQLRMLITHRRTVPFAIAHKEHTFTFGKTNHNRPVEIDQHGPGSPSYYQIQDNKVIQVNRVLGAVAVRVDLLESQDTPTGYLGTRYRAAFHYLQTGDELEQREYQDTYTKVAGYYLPTHQVIHQFEGGQTKTTDLTFTNLKLLN